MIVLLQPAARADILEQFRYYLEQGSADTGQRFIVAVERAVDAVTAMPDAGAPRHFDNPQLAGLRIWSIKGFDEIRIYYLVRGETLTVVRVLHGRRDIGSLLG